MRKLTIVFLCLLFSALAEAQQRRPQASPQAGDPLPGLTAAQRADFNDGRGDFTEIETVAEGLGPVFNERSCAACHAAPVPGGGSRRLVTRFATRTNGAFDPLTNLGGSLVQDHAIGPPDGSTHPFRPERVPQAATIVVRRRSTPLFGLGLVDATPDATFLALAGRGDAPGRVNLVDNIRAGMKTVGKFGWKAQVPSLFQFAGDAYLNEMGITSADFPNENCPQGNCAELAFNPAPGINDDGSRVAAARPADRRRQRRRGRLPARRLRVVPRRHAPHRIEPRRRARSPDLSPLLRLPPPRHGRARRQPRDGRRQGSRDAHRAALGPAFRADVSARRAREHTRRRHPRARRAGPRVARPLRRADARRPRETDRFPAVALTHHFWHNGGLTHATEAPMSAVIHHDDGRVELQSLDRIESSPLYNEDLAPVPVARRNWSAYNYAALWISMAHCIPTYMLSSGLIGAGMNWWQALITILLGNTIVLIPILLNSHPGTKY